MSRRWPGPPGRATASSRLPRELHLNHDKSRITEDKVRDALAHLYDHAYLSQHELLPLLVRHHMPDPMARTQHLRSQLIEAVYGLRPPASLAQQSREWRRYLALVYRYLDDMSPEQIERELSISERQLFRDLKGGVALLTAKLQAQLPLADQDEQEALAASLRRVGLRLERLQLGALCQQVLPLVQGLADGMGKAVHVEDEGTAGTAVADAALSRQALISALSYALRRGFSDVKLRPRHDVRLRTLVIQFREDPAPVGDARRDALGGDALGSQALEVASQLLEQQGGSLDREQGDDGLVELRLHWQRFEEPPIVMIEDDPGILRLFSRCLDGHGYRVIAATDGREAVRLASENQARLVLLDVMMRDMDGWAVLQRLKADPATHAVPVLVCSVINEPQLATTLGAAGLLKKPVSCEQLVDAVATVIGI